MKAKAVRLHGANDLRLDEFELPEIKDDEILVKVISDSVCMSPTSAPFWAQSTSVSMKMWQSTPPSWVTSLPVRS